jgi:hypothetical protein
VRLAAKCDPRIQASSEQVIRSLEGKWLEEGIFVLGQAFELYAVYQQQIAQCDTRVAAHFHSQFSTKSEGAPLCLRSSGTRSRARALRSLIYVVNCTVLAAWT